MATKFRKNNLDFRIIQTKEGVGGLVPEKDAGKFLQKAKTAKEKRQEEIREYRREASRLAALANKRIKRLEENGLQNSPAYQHYLKTGAQKFGVRGKDYNEVQAEVARMKRFIDAKTSTVRGINNHLKEMAAITGIKYRNMTHLREMMPKFFELSAKVEEYLRLIEDSASAIGYQRIWESINMYTQQNKIDLSAADVNVDDFIEVISDALTHHQKVENISMDQVHTYEANLWFKLPKD